jgi:hypothetical protein
VTPVSVGISSSTGLVTAIVILLVIVASSVRDFLTGDFHPVAGVSVLCPRLQIVSDETLSAQSKFGT